MKLRLSILAVCILVLGATTASPKLKLLMSYKEARRALFTAGFVPTNGALASELSPNVSDSGKEELKSQGEPFSELGDNEVGCTFVDTTLCFAVWRRGPHLFVLMTRSDFSLQDGPTVFGYYQVVLNHPPTPGALLPRSAWDWTVAVPGSIHRDKDDERFNCVGIACNQRRE